MNTKLSSTVTMLWCALLGPFAAAGEQWVSESFLSKPHGWYEVLTKLETTRVDLFSVTNSSLADALRLASDKFEAVRGRPLSHILRLPVGYDRQVSVTLREVSMVALYDALAEAAGLRWRMHPMIVFFPPDDEAALTLWRGVPTPAGRYLFDRLPPRVCTHGPPLQIAYLPERNLLMYQDQERRGEGVMNAFYSVGLITNIEVLVKDGLAQSLTP